MADKEIPEMIDKILKSKDPAAVGVKRILKRKTDKTDESVYREYVPEDFGKLSSNKDENQERSLFSDEEKRVMELEKENIELKNKLQGLNKKLESERLNFFEKGKKEGYAEGYKKAGEEEAEKYKKSLEGIRDNMERGIQELKTASESYFNGIKKFAIDISMGIAEKVIKREIERDDDQILRTIESAVKHAASKESLKIRVAEDDMKTVKENKDIWESVAEKSNDVVVERDDRIEKGGCIVESTSGIIDARIGILTDEMKKVISDSWEEVSKNKETDEQDIYS
ncbi:MAG: FliH/SctL family protein [Chitinivibrionales bacterium]